MIEADDWRLANPPRNIHGAVLRRARYMQASPTWDHEHCVFCWQKIAESRFEDALHEAYIWQAKDEWICPVCVADLSAHFGWTVIDEDAAPAS